VVDAILNVTSNTEVREAMLLGSGLESGWRSNAVGDNNTSFGPFQMHIGGALTAAGGTPAEAENPTWAAQHMLGAYESAVQSIPQSLWQSDPEQAAEQAAVRAERPQVSYYQSQGTARVNQWWASTKQALSGNVGGTGTTGIPIPGPGIPIPGLGTSSNPLSIPQDIINFFDTANSFLTKLLWLENPANWIRIVAFLFGVVLLMMAIRGFILAGQGESPLKMPQGPSVVPVPV